MCRASGTGSALLGCVKKVSEGTLSPLMFYVQGAPLGWRVSLFYYLTINIKMSY